MVLSGLLFQRAFLGAVLAILLSGSTICLRAAEPADIAGTMPEDYLPELKKILEQATKRSPELLAKEFERLSQEARITMVNAARLPQLGGGFSYGISQVATTGSATSRDSGFRYNFGFSQALFHWGALKNETDSARINLLVTSKNFALAHRELAGALRKAYLALIVEKARVIEARESLRLVKLDVEIAKVRKEDGSISGAALATAELTQRETELVVARFENEFEANRRRFARLAGLPGLDLPEDAIPAEIPAPAYSEPRTAAIAAEFMRDNARGSLEFELYDLRLREAVLRQKIESTRLLPKFGLTAGYSLQNTTTVDGNTARQSAVAEQNVGIGASWNIFDGFATRGAKRGALIARRSLEYGKSVEIEKLLQNAQILERTLRIDAEQVSLAEIRHGNAVAGRDLVADEVSHGTRPKGDIDRAQIHVLQAYARSLEARAAYLSRWTDFVALTGEDPILNLLPVRDVRKKK